MFIDLLGYIIGGIFGIYTSMVILSLIDDKTLSHEVRVKYPDALKLLIQEKKKNAVKVGIFGKGDTKIVDSVEITSDQGVSDNIYVGQEIYL